MEGEWWGDLRTLPDETAPAPASSQDETHSHQLERRKL